VGDHIFIAAGSGGVQVHTLATGTKKAEIPLPSTTLNASVVVSNAVAVDNDLVFISNGEAGVYVAQAAKPIQSIKAADTLSLTMVGKLKFADLQSVNHVIYKGNYLFIAAGLGGLKIVYVTN
jgi:hypothetical protein